MKNSKFRALLIVLIVIVVIAVGLGIGNWKGSDSVSKMYDRKNFTLLDDSGSLFQLSDFPKEKKLLLLFTPDGVPPSDVVPFYTMNQNLHRLESINIITILITRTNREIVRNFKLAAKFQGKILLDPSGTVGKLVGVWPDRSPVDYWSYALIDSEFKGYWLTTTKKVFSVDDILTLIPKPLKKTSNASP